MAVLYQNVYDNPSRVITGNVGVFPDDVQLLCDTNLGSVTIDLCLIPTLKWNVNYKLYVVDSTNNAGSNNITINAAAGQTINGGSSIVINTSGGGCMIQVGSNTSYIATFYPLTGSGTVTSITALDPLTGGTITTSGNIGFSDTGWINCEGFEHMAGSDRRPQFRIYGKQVFLRGTAIVPLANAGVYVPMLVNNTGTGYYVADAYGSPFTGISGSIVGVTALGSGSLVFNQGLDIIPNSYVGAKTYTEVYSQMVVGARPIATSAPNTYIYLTGMYVIRFGKIGVSSLRVDSVREYESGSYDLSGGLTGSLGTSNVRQVVGRVKLGQYMPNYERMVGFTDATSSSSSSVSFPQDYDIYYDAPSLTNPTFNFDVDSSRASDMGGFQFSLDGISTFLD